MRLCLITMFLMISKIAFGQGIEINAKIGGFSVSSNGNSFQQEASEYSIKSSKPKHFNKAVDLLKEARKERNAEVKFCVDRIVEKVAVSQPSCPSPPPVCHCQPLLPLPPVHCCDPGPIPHCVRVKCWLNSRHTDFIDCNGRKWHWCTRNCVWVNS